jgi:predicted RNase H-like HicB family nuclease
MTCCEDFSPRDGRRLGTLNEIQLVMKLTAVFVPAAEGGYTALVEEIPGAISEGETIEEARENLADALRMILECNREIARQHEPAESRRETIELAAL